MATAKNILPDNIGRVRADLGAAESLFEHDNVDVWEILAKLRKGYRDLGSIINDLEELSNDALKAALEKDDYL